MGDHCHLHPMTLHFFSQDVDASIAFYSEVLGFKLESRWPTEGVALWANLSLEGQSIMFGSPVEDCSEETPAFHASMIADWKQTPGGGVLVYVRVDDVDAYYAEVMDNGGQPACEPKNEFYGLRNFLLQDIDGYRIAFYSPLQMTSCQSCDMPLTDAKEGQMYCEHCTDDEGQLRSYVAILEGTTSGYFMGMLKMERPAAELAAKEHLAKMPAWSHQA